MKTGNGAKPNPKGIWGKGMKCDDSMMVKAKTGGTFSAKKGTTNYPRMGRGGRGK